MLNRLFIIVGVVAILAIAAAFVVPSFIPWGEYRARLAAIAEEALGTPVRIDGDVSFSLLPQPKLRLADVSAGPEDAPNLVASSVEAEFSLIDFLRDRYNVTRLELYRPTLAISVRGDGSVSSGLALPGTVSSNVAIANAVISEGTVLLTDERTGEKFAANDVSGELRLEASRGPFVFQGNGKVGNSGYTLRVASGAFDTDGVSTLSLNVRPSDNSFSMAAEGTLQSGLVPDFMGTVTWRQPPPKPAEGSASDAGRGDLVLTSRVEASPARVLLSDYVVTPDENRATTRLQGAAEVKLGQGMSFNAVVSGGVLALPPRDATTEQATEPYELLRLLRELPVPPAPAIAGTIGMDIAELNLRAVSLRNVRLDARAHDGAWTVTGLSGTLPGSTTVSMSGEVTVPAGKPEFSGRLKIASDRLDALATLWRRPADGNPLFGLRGSLDARVDLVGDTLSISDTRLTLDGKSPGEFSAQIGLGARDLHLSAKLGSMDGERSAALFALLPDLRTDSSFATSFGKGQFDVAAETLSIDGLAGRALAAKGTWEGGVLVFDRLTAEDLGGVAFDAKLTGFGSFQKPELSGSAKVSVRSADAPAVAKLYRSLRTSPTMVQFLSRSFPASFDMRLDAPTGDGAQSLSVDGKLASANAKLDAEIRAGFLRALSGPVKLRVELNSTDAAAMTAQLGLGDVPLFADGVPVHLVGVLDGNVANSLETTVLVDGGEDALGFSGNMLVTNPDRFSGKGTFKAKLTDPSTLAAWLGAGGISLPALSGSATLAFDGASSLTLDGIVGKSGAESFSGKLAFADKGAGRTVTGALEVSRADVAGLLETLLGPAALLQGAGRWPDGPLSSGDTPRSSSGRVSVRVPALDAAGREVARDLRFDLDWDETAARLRSVTAKVGEGQVGLELSVCCAGPHSDKQVSGRISLKGVSIDSIAPSAVADALDGVLDASGQFQGTGGSIADILSAMAGEGTYGISGLRIERLDPLAPNAISGVADVLEMQATELTALIEQRLEAGAFVSPQVAGNFTIAGGILRSPNVSMEGEGGQLFGSGSIRLDDLVVAGDYALTQTEIAPAALAGTGSARVMARLSGTLEEPVRDFDVSGLVDAVMVKAYEAEVERLERLRAEDEARKAAAMEAARQAEEEAAAKRAAEDAATLRAAEAAMARKAEEDAAAKKAAADAAARDEAIRKALEELDKPMDIGLGN